LEKTNNKGVIQIYSSLCKKAKQEYIYYELMELGEMDWEKEINLRRQKNLYYTENELINISSQLIKTLSLMQKYHITHRDIKPQNILIVNGKYKLCDFGEIRIMEREGIVVQRIRGSELYMSPILFYGLRANMIQVKHNTYKSDVFSLGMCIIYAATMYFNCTDEIREITDMKIIYNVLNKYLGERYSNKLISLIFIMIQIEEELRPDFIKLEENLNTLLSI
jgi:serine/threonine protein kinase